MSEAMEEVSGNQANKSVEKCLKILEFLAVQPEPVRLLDISKALKMNSSTVLRFLTSLMLTGYVAQESDSLRYYLTYRICYFANHVSQHMDLRQMARPYMQQLSDMFNESSCLAIEQEGDIVYIEVLERQVKMLRSMQRIGKIAPMHCTGIGKLLLLNKSEEEIDALIKEKGMVQFTENTFTTKVQLMEELKKVREQGYAYDNEECEIGARCVAFPIRDYRGMYVAGLSVTGPVSRMTDSMILTRIEAAKALCNDLSKKLGFEAEV